jgi:DNA polymerase III delta prime subunit
MNLENYAWAEKFRPKNISECFLPPDTLDYVNKIIESDDLPHLLLSGPPGIGKTTLALALINQLDMEYLKVNSSLNGGIDTLRVEIQQFASTISMNGKKKVVLLDEADYLTAASQAAFRGFIDEFGANAVFILTANFQNKIIDPVKSRLDTINILFNKNDKTTLAKGLFSFIMERLKEENVDFDVKAVQKFIVTQIGQTTDIRAIITKAQKIAKTGVFNDDSLLDDFAGKFDEIIEAITKKNFGNMRKWVGENSDIEPNFLYRHIYDNLKRLAKDDNQIIAIISILNEHQYKHQFVADREINLVSCLCEISTVL